MAINPLFRSSPMRMMGLSSGMDTDSIIQQTLRIHQMRIDTQMRQRTLLQWRQETLNSVRDQITGFRNTFLSSLGSTTMMQRGVFNSTVATLSSASNAFSATSTINSSVGNMKIGAIESIAKGASVSSLKSVSADKNGFASSQRLDSLQFVGGNKIQFSNYQASSSADGSKVKINQSTAQSALAGADWTSKATLDDGREIVLTRRGSGDSAVFSYSLDGGDEMDIVFESDGTFKIPTGDDEEGSPTYFELNKLDGGQIGHNGNALAFTKTANVSALKEDGTTTTVTLVERENGQILHNGNVLEFVGTTKIDINGKGIELRSNMTLSQMLSTVNGTSGIGATMSYDRLSDSFKLESNTIGASSTLTVSDAGGGNALALFGLTGSGSVSSTGSSAVLYINNERIERNTNNFEFRGVAITLHGVKDGSTDIIPEHVDDVTVTLKRDATDAVNRIKGFIEAYNSIIKRIEGLVRERKSSFEASYKPLTDEEKSVMSEKQIADWEAIAKKGILRNDPGMQNLAANLRRSLFDSVSAAGLSASEIGLSTGNFFDGTGGQIILNEDKLKAALEANPERVADAFIGSTDINASYGEKGLLRRINESMRDYVNVSQTRTLQNLENSIVRANEQMAKMQQRMYAEEDKLYRQFAAMETALSKIQSQGDWFTAMLGGGK